MEPGIRSHSAGYLQAYGSGTKASVPANLGDFSAQACSIHAKSTYSPAGCLMRRCVIVRVNSRLILAVSSSLPPPSMLRGSIHHAAVVLLLGLLFLGTVPASAQQETLVYLPFPWDDFNNQPVYAANLGVDAVASQTTWGLYERPLDREVGPATVVQGPATDQPSLVYAAPLADGLPPQTLTGACTITTPVAVCSFNVEVPTAQVVVRPSRIPGEGDTRETGRPRNGAVATEGMGNWFWGAVLSSSVVLIAVGVN